MVSVLNISDGHQLDVWIINLLIAHRRVGEAGVNVFHCESCQNLEN